MSSLPVTSPAAHTPTPWRIQRDCIETDGTLIAAAPNSASDDELTHWIEVDAPHIVRCVNAHDALVKVISDAVAIIEAGGSSVSLWNHMVVNARAALAKAAA